MPLKSKLGNSYFGRLFSSNKVLFILVLFFTIGTLFSNLIRLTTTPFFIWGIYSEKAPPKSSYTFYEVRYERDRLINLRHTWDQARSIFVYDPLQYYIDCRIKGKPDGSADYLKNHWGRKHPRFAFLVKKLYPGQAAFDSFPAWYKRYLSGLSGAPVENICVLEKEVAYTPDGAIKLLKSDTLLVIP